MPTGYTASIADGISFEKFAMGCARQFGALVMMRDEPQSAEIPEEFKPSDYYQKELIKSKSELKALKKMSPKEISKEARKEYNDKVECNQKGRTSNNKQLSLYKAMLLEVRAWQPPSTDHEDLKNFMIQQIEDSIKWDCNNSYYIDNPPKLLSVDEWLTEHIAKVLRYINYHQEENIKEIERTNGRNLWLKQLRDSLK